MNPEFHRAADAAVARGQIDRAIALLEDGLAKTEGDYTGWMKLAALRRGVGHTDQAVDAVDAALDVRPNDFMGLLLKGSLFEQLGELDRAAEIYRAVVHHANDQAQLPAQIMGQLNRVRQFLTRYRSGVEARLSVMAELDEPHRERALRFVDNVLDRRPAYHQNPTHYRYPGLADVEFFDHHYESLRDRLRSATPNILVEYKKLIATHSNRQRPYVDFPAGQPVGPWKALNRSADWTAYHLIRYGEHDPINAAACPQTIAAFLGNEQAVVPGLGPNLMFSILAPHTHIPPHHGVANFRVVCHLPLIVPAGCRFRVGAEIREWQVGEPLIFDDTIEHEAWNDSGVPRAVLIGDLWRPELDAQDRSIVCDLAQAQSLSKFGAL